MAVKVVPLVARELVMLQRKYDELDVRIFLFGSAIKGKTFINDIDVLVVYRKLVALDGTKDELASISMRFPIDVVFMSTDEEREFDFISGQDAVPVSNFDTKVDHFA